MIIYPSTRLGEVKEYYFSTKLAQIRQMEADGKDVLNLGIGNPDGMPEASVIEELIHQSQQAGVHGYQSYAGLPALKEAIADWNHWAYDISIDAASEVLPLIGSKEGITHISLAFLDEGDQVLVPELAYPAYAAVAQMCKAEIIRFPLNALDNYQPEWSFFDGFDFSKVKLMWLNYPHMPTGAAASLSTFERLIDMARTNHFLIVHDNPYSMILPKDDPLSILVLPNAKEVCLELNSLSKSFNMAGWRVGWVIGQEDYIKTILKVKSNVDSGMFKPMMMAAVKALALREEWFDELNKIYAKRRDIVFELLDTLGCTYRKDQQGLFVWAKIPEEELGAEEMVDRLLDDHHVFMTPGFIFGEAGARYIRISLCSEENILKEALKRLS